MIPRVLLFIGIISLVGLIFIDGAVDLLRWVVAVAIIVSVWSAVRQRNPSVLLSPAFLMAGFVAIFYSALPRLIELFYVAPLMSHEEVVQIIKPQFVSYFGSAAETLVLAFATTLLVTHALLSGHTREPSVYLDVRPGRAERVVATVVIGLGVLLLIVSFETHRTGFIYSTLWTVYPPIQSILTMFLAMRFRTAGLPGFPLLALATAAAILPLAVLGQGKIPFFMLVGISLLLLSFGFPDRRKMLLGLLVVIWSFVVLVPISASLRDRLRPLATATSTSAAIAERLTMKLFSRQTNTGYCLMRVMEGHWDEAFEPARQLFLVEALVPRVLWPEKPNLSLGTKYAVDYCDYGGGTAGHSASITLLGQPIMIGGSTGLLVHGGLLVIFLGAITVLSRKSPSFGRVTVFALFPWWIDFDQDFALYAANLGKFFLVMCPAILMLYFIGRRNTR